MEYKYQDRLSTGFNRYRYGGCGELQEEVLQLADKPTPPAAVIQNTWPGYGVLDQDLREHWGAVGFQYNCRVTQSSVDPRVKFTVNQLDQAVRAAGMNIVLPPRDVGGAVGSINLDVAVAGFPHLEVGLINHNLVLLRDEDLDMGSETVDGQRSLVKEWIRDSEDLDDVFRTMRLEYAVSSFWDRGLEK